LEETESSESESESESVWSVRKVDDFWLFVCGTEDEEEDEDEDEEEERRVLSEG